MEWIALYEISGFALPMAALLGLILIFAGSGILRRFWDQENKWRTLNLLTGLKLAACLVAVITGAVLLSVEGKAFLSGDMSAASRAYKSGDYAVIEGVPEDLKWAASGYSFSMDGKNFYCEQNIQSRQRNKVEVYLNGEPTVRVSYYDGDYVDELMEEYAVVRLEVQAASE